jgi:hypothetical protein
MRREQIQTESRASFDTPQPLPRLQSSSAHGCFPCTYSPASRALHAESHCIAAMQAIAFAYAGHRTPNAFCQFLSKAYCLAVFPYPKPLALAKARGSCF